MQSDEGFIFSGMFGQYPRFLCNGQILQGCYFQEGRECLALPLFLKKTCATPILDLFTYWYCRYKAQNGKFLINTAEYPRTVLTFLSSTSTLMALGAKLM